MTRQQHAYNTLYSLDPHDTTARTFRTLIALLIICNALAVMLDTVEHIHAEFAISLAAFEWFSVAIFSAEYAVRLWVIKLNQQYQAKNGRLRYMLSPMALIDLIAILPSLLALAGLDLRMLRVLRLMRLLKLTRYAHALNTLARALRSRSGEIVVSALFMLMLMLLSSSFIYYAEHDAQPDIYTSIPAAWWWSVSTLATIGYGDIYPITLAGKITAALTAIFGIGLFALPGGIIASALMDTAKRPEKLCPHCGK